MTSKINKKEDLKTHSTIISPFEDGNSNMRVLRSSPSSLLQMTYMSVKLDFPYYKDDTLEIFSLPYEHDQLNEEISEAHMFLMR